MKVTSRLAWAILFILITQVAVNRVHAQGALFAFYTLGEIDGDIPTIADNIKNALKEESFEILGEYNPGKDRSLYVIAFTRKDLLDITMKISDGGAMAGALKIGLISNGQGAVEVRLLNPDYLFYAYLRDSYADHEGDLFSISTDVKIALSAVGFPMPPEDAVSIETNVLKNFRLLPNKPSFEDQIIVGEFDSFQAGLDMIRQNLTAQRNGAYKVYEIVDDKRKVAVFGVGLLDSRKGETAFLTLLGTKPVASMPYELILTGKKASMLDGSYRFPLYWTDLSTKELFQIRKIPREIQEIMEGLTH